MSALPIAPTSPSEPHLRTNGLQKVDRAAHDWYRFVLAFPPHLVRRYISEFNLTDGDVLLDPFCGTGTTLVEGKKLGLRTIGLEPNPLARFACEVKCDWSIIASDLQTHALVIAEAANAKIAAHRGRRRTLNEERTNLLLANSISPLPLHKTLILLEQINLHHHPRLSRFEKLALAKVLPSTIGNLHFGPEVGIGDQKANAAVVQDWLGAVDSICTDLPILKLLGQHDPEILAHDARSVSEVVAANSVKAVITSPPYPNEKDYTRTTRLESVILGFMANRQDLRNLKKDLIRSNTKNVYKGDSDHDWIKDHKQIQDLSDQLEKRRIELDKTSGFERLYPQVAKLYFGGLAKHLSSLRSCLQPGAKLAYVVGDQASYFQVMIRTGEILSDIAEDLGYSVVRRDIFRERHATATKVKLNEEVVILEWKGNTGRNGNARKSV